MQIYINLVFQILFFPKRVSEKLNITHILLIFTIVQFYYSSRYQHYTSIH